MADLRAYAAARLRLDGIAPARAAELVEEVARQLEDAYAESRAAGAGHETALAAAEAHVPDWEAFSRELLRGEPRPLEPRLEGAGRPLPLRLAADLLADLLHAGRLLRKSPTFGAVAVATLALGIGANAALFSFADALLLRTLPVHDPGQLRMLQWSAKRLGFYRSYDGMSRTEAGQRVAWSVSYPAYLHLRDHASSFASLAALGSVQRVNLGLRGGATLAEGLAVSGNFFETLGVQAALGRTVDPRDDRDGARVALLSHGAWLRLFGADPGVLGQTVSVNGTNVELVGILPRGVCGVYPSSCPDLFLPLALHGVVDASPDLRARADRWAFPLFGRLKPGVAEEQARSEAELLLRQAILAAKPEKEYDPPRVSLPPGGQGFDELRNELGPTLRLLGFSVATVLLAACANIAGLTLVRGTARRREIATRLALGAGRGRLVRQLLAESLLLAALGGALGALLAWLGAPPLVRALAGEDGTLGVTAGLDLRVLGFLAVLCVGTGLLAGLLPALRASALDPAPALAAARGASGTAQFRSGKALVTLQVGLSLVLVLGATLFVRSLLNLRAQSLGFRPEGLLVFQLNPLLNGYTGERLLDFHERVLEQAAALPGVRSASMSRWGVLAGGRTRDGIGTPGGAPITTHVHYVAPRFFETLGLPLRAGRDVAPSDREGTAPVVVINEALARGLRLSGNPIGERLSLGGAGVEVVGLAADSSYESLRNPAPPTVYVPFRQNRQFSMTYVLRCDADPGRLAAALRRMVARIDPNVPLYEIRTQADQLERALRRERLFALSLTGFGLLTLALAAIGVYGTLAYLVARRTPEIGVRLALGATRADVVRLVLSEAGPPVLAGIAAGLWAALAAAGLVRSLLFELVPQDTAAMLTAASLLFGAALLASWLPARRAANIAPVEALRGD